MAEVLTNVYDILFPSPPPLQEIAAISIALRLWCEEINAHRINNTLSQLNLGQDILSNDSLPHVSATIISLIKTYVRKAGLSIQQWLFDHGNNTSNIFGREIFKDFIDFVGDFDGSIHYVRTARKLVQCDRIDKILRFKIACWYCFEDDILQIWPSVSNDIHINFTNVSRSAPIPVPHYWICKLKNRLYKLPRSNDAGQSIEEQIFCNFFPAWSLKEYFWNRFDVDSRMRIARDPPAYASRYTTKFFSRFLFAKFNEVELDEFANGLGYSFIAYLLRCSFTVPGLPSDNDSFQNRAPHFRAVWVLVKDKMNGEKMFCLIKRIAEMLYKLRESFDTSVCCELWNSVPDHLKLEVTRAISEEYLFMESDYFHVLLELAHIHSLGLFNFLYTMLSDASVEVRNQFWDKNWIELMNVMDTTQLNRLLKLCFDNDENKITEFKTTALTAAMENIRTKCLQLLYLISCEELNKFLVFWYPDDEQTRKTIKMNLLVEDFNLYETNIKNVSPLLIDFINDVYDDINLARDFRTQLLFSQNSLELFEEFTVTNTYANFHHVMSAIDVIAPSEQIARDFKKRQIYSIFEQKLRAGALFLFADGEFSKFLRQCLVGDDEIARFRETLPIYEIVQNMIRTAMTAYGDCGPKYNCFLVQLLEWYFPTPQALEEFKTRYADDDEFVILTTPKSQ